MQKGKIISNPGILGGKPIIEGTRISVELILDNLAAGISEKEILEAYPHLIIEQVHAAVAYANSLVKKKSSSPMKKQIGSAILYTHEISR